MVCTIKQFQIEKSQIIANSGQTVNQNQKLTPLMNSWGSIAYVFRHLICYYSMKNLKIAELLQKSTGVYILQNTMARGGKVLGEKWKLRQWGQNEEGKRGKGKEKKGKGGEWFFCWYMAHTFVVNCVLTWSYDCMLGPLRGKMAPGE